MYLFQPTTMAVISELLHTAAPCCTYKCTAHTPSLPHTHASIAARPRGTQASHLLLVVELRREHSQGRPLFLLFCQVRTSYSSVSALLLTVCEYSPGPQPTRDQIPTRTTFLPQFLLHPDQALFLFHRPSSQSLAQTVSSPVASADTPNPGGSGFDPSFSRFLFPPCIVFFSNRAHRPHSLLGRCIVMLLARAYVFFQSVYFSNFPMHSYLQKMPLFCIVNN